MQEELSRHGQTVNLNRHSRDEHEHKLHEYIAERTGMGLRTDHGTHGQYIPRKNNPTTKFKQTIADEQQTIANKQKIQTHNKYKQTNKQMK